MKDVVTFAQQVLDMQAMIEWQQQEITRLQEYEVKYNKLLNETIAHEKQMIGSMVNLALCAIDD